MAETGEQIGVINLGKKELNPDDEAAYRAKIAAAKKATPLSALKGSTPLGGVEKVAMPVFKTARDTVEAPPNQGVVPRPPGSPVLREETKHQLSEALKAGAEQAKVEASEKALDEKKLVEDAKLAQILSGIDFGDQRGQIDRILDNTIRREGIEKRCAPMDFEDLLMKDEVQQRVPIIPGKFEPLFRSVRPVETLYLKTLMARETIHTEQYLGEKYSLLLLTCSLSDINGHPLPDHRKHKADGTFEVDDAAFVTKLTALTNKSSYIIADLSVNYSWFDVRVRKLLNPDDVKNG